MIGAGLYLAGPGACDDDMCICGDVANAKKAYATMADAISSGEKVFSRPDVSYEIKKNPGWFGTDVYITVWGKAGEIDVPSLRLSKKIDFWGTIANGFRTVYEYRAEVINPAGGSPITLLPASWSKCMDYVQVGHNFLPRNLFWDLLHKGAWDVYSARER